VPDQREVAVGKRAGQDDVAKPVLLLKGVEALGFIREPEVLRELRRAAQHEARVDVRTKARVQLPDQVTAVVVRREQRAIARQRRERSSALGRYAERARLGEARLMRRRHARDTQHSAKRESVGAEHQLPTQPVTQPRAHPASEATSRNPEVERRDRRGDPVEEEHVPIGEQREAAEAED
jgi:hypothetical protein